MDRNKIRFPAVIVLILAMLAMNVGDALALVSQSPAQSSQNEEQECGRWKNGDQPGLGNVVPSMYGAVVVRESGSSSWTSRDVSAGEGGYERVTTYPLCPGITLPAGTDLSGLRDPRSKETHNLLLVSYVLNADGSVTILSVEDTGQKGKGHSDSDFGFVDVTPAPLIEEAAFTETNLDESLATEESATLAPVLNNGGNELQGEALGVQMQNSDDGTNKDSTTLNGGRNDPQGNALGVENGNNAGGNGNGNGHNP